MLSTLRKTNLVSAWHRAKPLDDKIKDGFKKQVLKIICFAAGTKLNNSNNKVTLNLK